MKSVSFLLTSSAGSHSSLDYNQEQLLERLNVFQAPYLQEKLMSKGIFQTQEEYQHTFIEFKKFAGLSAVYGKTLSMTSERVDEVWHQFILFTRQYHDFCNEYVGRYLHHSPKTSLTPLSEDSKGNFVDLYQRTFGQIPGIWNLKEGSLGDCGESVCSNHCSSAPACQECTGDGGGDD